VCAVKVKGYAFDKDDKAIEKARKIFRQSTHEKFYSKVASRYTVLQVYNGLQL